MAERLNPLHRAVKLPSVYEAIQTALGADRFRDRLTAEVFRPEPGMRVLDIGCGPGVMRPLLGDVAYTGVDFNARHIEQARAKGQPGDRYLVGDATKDLDQADGAFDLVLMVGLLHHIDDAGCRALLQRATEMIAPGGRAITLDGVRVPRQRTISRLLQNMDAGKMIRTAEGYLALTKGLPATVEQRIYNDLLRIPFDHCVMIIARD